MTGPALDPVEVQRIAAQLTALPDAKFAEALADNVMDPVAEETAAFRSDDLAPRSLIAAEFLIANVNSTIQKKADENDAGWQRRAEHFRSRVGMERRFLKDIVAGIYARQGRIDNRPQPRRRAQERLWSLVMAGRQVDRDTLRELVEDEERKVAAARAAEKEKRKAAKRAAQDAERRR